jgi:hypothetical protein
MWIALLALVALLAPPTTEPGPPSPPAPQEATLAQGVFHYTLPAGWKLRAKGADDLTAHYTSPDGKAILSIVVLPMKQRISDEMLKQIPASLSKKIVADAEKEGAEVLTQPHEEPDDRFAIKLFDRTRKGNKTTDRMHAYRRETSMLISVVCKVTADDHDQAMKTHELATSLLADGTLGSIEGPSSKPPSATTKPSAQPKSSPTTGPAEPTVLGKARLRVASPPPGWRVQKQDVASGIVVTYHERAGENGLIIVSVRTIPADAKNDPKLRDLVIDEMTRDAQSSMQLPGAKEIGKPSVVKDDRFLRKTGRHFDVQGSACTVVTRQRVIGDCVVSVASLAEDERAAEVDSLGDAVAVSVTRIGR